MEVVPGIDAWIRPDGPTVVTIGMFDGVHLGHRRIIEVARRKARDRKMRCIVFTFDHHPLETLKPGKHPPYLSSSAQKLRLLEELDVDTVLMVSFDEAFACMSPEEFFQELIVNRLNAAAVVVGENFRFGKGAKGDVELMRELARGTGVEIIAVPLLRQGKDVISSTSIRRLLERGEVEEAGQRLGRPYVLEGFVAHGAHRGKELGFPTANLEIHDNRCLPANGVYAGEAFLEGHIWPSGIYVGSIPTFKGHHRRRVEVHLLDFDGDIYGKYLGVAFHRRIREEKAFRCPDELRLQITEDLKKVRSST